MIPSITLKFLNGHDSSSNFFFFNKFIYLFIYFCLCWVFVSVHGLPLVAASRGHSSSRCAGLSLSRPLLLCRTGSRRTGSVVAAHGLSSCGSRAQLLRGMWDLPRPGLEPGSPALAGRFSTTAPPGKPLKLLFYTQTWGPGITLFEFFPGIPNSTFLNWTYNFPQQTCYSSFSL